VFEDEIMADEIGALDSDCQAGRMKVHEAAIELYHLAAHMLGDESQAAELVEAAISQTNIDPCVEADASFDAARVKLVETAVTRLSQADPQAFIPPALSGGPSGCIESEDLASAGISAGQLAGMVNDPERCNLRDWLNKLPLAQRTIFVQRAILGWDNAAAALSLSRASSRNWQLRQVSEVFRQALCSLATSLMHSAVLQA
jgi:hypothetical protein